MTLPSFAGRLKKSINNWLGRIDHLMKTATPSILISVDYELFGNGEGSIQDHILRPTELLLSFLMRKGLRATFFIETAEFLAMGELVRSGRGPLGLQKDYAEILLQIEKLFRLGHDVQLHYHPQWSRAVWSAEGWSLPAQASLLGTGQETLLDHLLRGKHFLENLGKPIRPSYCCQIFRAGMLHYDRRPETGRILHAAGMRADSSMARGYWHRNPFADIDDRDLLDIHAPFWHTLDGSPSEPVPGALLEIPVWSVFESQWHKLTAGRLLTKLIRNRSQVRSREDYQRTGRPSNPFSLASWLASRQANLWDFTLMSSRQLIRHFRRALVFHPPGPYLPLVMIGHTKELNQLKSLGRFYDYVSDAGRPEWHTLSEAFERILSYPIESRG
jgi:hypothetical protein